MFTTRDKEGVNGYTPKKYIQELKDQLATADEHEKEIILAKIEGAEKVAELARMSNARYRDANRKEYADYQRDYQRIYREKNKQKLSEYRREYYLKKKLEK